MNRRDFLNRLMAGAAALGAPAAFYTPSAARGQSSDQPSSEGAAPRLLAVTSRTIEVNGKATRVFGLGQPDGTQGLFLDAESDFNVALANEADASTLIHWHGLTPPWKMDGVPDNPAALLHPAEIRRYSFPAGMGGTHWMHAHTLQEQNLLAAPLIVRTTADRQRDEQEVVILLHDFSFTPAEELLVWLRSMASADSMPMDHSAMGHGAAIPAAGARDINDIEYDAYLANDRTLDDPQVVTVEKGGRVRLRIINGATATGFTIDIGSLEGALIAVDGQAVQPVAGNTFPISMGQRLDIRLQLPRAGGTHPILALREGAPERTGIILAYPGARIGKISVLGQANGPVLDLNLERGLRAAEPLAKRDGARRLAVTLTGNMAGYSWGIGGDALQVTQGERIEVTLANTSMMAHPMHLHGHHFQVVDINGKTIAGAVRDTVLVPPQAALTIAFDANNPGRWPLHCHHLYHMAAGMMAFVDVAT